MDVNVDKNVIKKLYWKWLHWIRIFLQNYVMYNIFTSVSYLVMKRFDFISDNFYFILCTLLDIDYILFMFIL